MSDTKMKTVILIPARFASTRYPGKPLVELTGSDGVAKSLILRSSGSLERATLDVSLSSPRRPDKRGGKHLEQHQTGRQYMKT